MPQVRVGVLGPLVVSGATVPEARQQRVLLAALAAVAPGGLAPDRLVHGLWRYAPADARKALQVLVTRLRKALAPAALDIALADDGYRLVVEPAAIDLVRFRRILGGVTASVPVPLRRELLDEALALWRGEPFADLADEPLLADRAAALRLEHDEAVSLRHEALLELHESGLVPELGGWAHAHPLDERAWCHLAVALHRAGRPTEALRALHTHRVAVRTTAGLEPTARVVELEDQILTGAVPSRRAPSTGNLPGPSRELLGRASELVALTAQLTTGVVTSVVGVGGVGKTTLAVHAAAGVGHRHRDGVWLCELADIATDDAVIDALALTLGVRQQRGATLLASVTAGFRDADALVILDNCEHVRAGAAEVAAALCRACPGLTLLATSREPLGTTGERVFTLAPLSVPAQGTSDSASCVLFVQRAREAGATVPDDAMTEAAVAEVCRRLDGLPLAIELAAARARTMSIQEMSERLDERFRLLTRSTTGPRRQRTLRDAVDWSYRLLTPDEQDVFDHLAVFLGGFDITAAAAVSARTVDDVETIVWSLTERSLLQLSDTTAPSRYHLLETLRHFGLERLAVADRLAAALARHRQHFVALAGRAAEGLRGPDEKTWVRSITAELANLRAAHHHAVTAGAAADAGALVASLHVYAEWRQFFELGTWASATLALDGRPPEQVPILYAVAGWATCISGDYDEAARLAHAGLEAEVVGIECGWLHDVLAHAAYFRGDVPLGLAHADAEIARARRSGDRYRLSYVLADSGVHACLAGDTACARGRSSEALALAEQTGNPSVISMAQLAVAFANRADDPPTAMAWFQRAAALADTIDSTWTSAVCRGELSVLLGVHGDAREALQLASAQLRAFRRAGDSGRVAGAVRWTIPALHRLLDPARHLDLVALDAGATSRPQIREPFNDRVIADVIRQVAAKHDDETIAHTVASAAALDTAELVDRTLDLIDEALRTPA